MLGACQRPKQVVENAVYVQQVLAHVEQTNKAAERGDIGNKDSGEDSNTDGESDSKEKNRKRKRKVNHKHKK